MEKARVDEAKLSEVMARAGYGGERFLIGRRGRSLAALVGVGDLRRLEEVGTEVGTSGRPRGGARPGVGGLVEDGEIDAMLKGIYSVRGRDLDRRVDLDA